jgi:hypothetical protein
LLSLISLLPNSLDVTFAGFTMVSSFRSPCALLYCMRPRARVVDNLCPCSLRTLLAHMFKGITCIACDWLPIVWDGPCALLVSSNYTQHDGLCLSDLPYSLKLYICKNLTRLRLLDPLSNHMYLEPVWFSLDISGRKLAIRIFRKPHLPDVVWHGYIYNWRAHKALLSGSVEVLHLSDHHHIL